MLGVATIRSPRTFEKMGDGDFVSATKLARREGVDFVLDSMWNNIEESLFEHIDGLKSTNTEPKPKSKDHRKEE